MREIKFRAWDLEVDEMCYDFLENNWLRVCIASPYVKLMQFTGLVDKNGVEIYEGDIVNLYSGRCKAIVEFKDGCFVVSYSGTNETIYENLDDIEILGNIYEHPHLLEGVK